MTRDEIAARLYAAAYAKTDGQRSWHEEHWFDLEDCTIAKNRWRRVADELLIIADENFLTPNPKRNE